jgi:hypothetical protein
MAIYKGDAPEFIIRLSDLPHKIRKELADLRTNNPSEYRRVVSEAIDRLCEIDNYEYFHRSAAGFPKKWRFEE